MPISEAGIYLHVVGRRFKASVPTVVRAWSSPRSLGLAPASADARSHDSSFLSCNQIQTLTKSSSYEYMGQNRSPPNSTKSAILHTNGFPLRYRYSHPSRKCHRLYRNSNYGKSQHSIHCASALISAAQIPIEARLQSKRLDTSWRRPWRFGSTSNSTRLSLQL